MNTSQLDAEAACRDCLKRFFSEYKCLAHLQNDSMEVLRLLVAAGVQLTGSPAGWAAGIVYAVANDAKRPCGVPGILNADFERAFGVTMSTVRKRVGAVQRSEVLWRLDTTPRAVPEAATGAEPRSSDAKLSGPGGGFTYREEANVLTLLAFRNGPIEDLHAGSKPLLPQEPDVSRITDEEMKTLTIFTSRKLAEWLALRDSDRDAYFDELARHWPAVSHWQR